KRESVYGRTQADVLAKKDALLKVHADGLPVLHDRQSFAAYLEEWLEGKSSKLRPRVHLRYGQLIRVHVVPTLGNVKLTKVSPQQLERLYAARLATGAKPRTVRNIHAVIHNALEQAARWGLVAR